ncbi:MAG: hypothetical protein CL920_20770 [Deltaproteobacteria bacterium]|nr:hypothetical protein [Deltaproteobacteria bacterium]MBU51128.1 hypothetical protein [Deltaproteobacteria bacterium]|tara:strand:- start:4807 stop:5535 length:729 start_codon:yes stop_codon:yes gene_type:complete
MSIPSIRQGSELFEPYQVVFEDDAYLIINKPPALPSTGMKMSDPYCLQSILCDDYGRMIWAVHQLDADTSGVNIFVMQKQLVSQVKARMELPQTKKTYLTLCHGHPEREMWVESPIGPTSCQRGWGVTAHGKYAKTHLEVLESVGDVSLVRVEIVTGRTHQIRVHLAHIGHPLVGEDWYIDEVCPLHPRQALHAYEIAFADGVSPEGWRAPLREDMRALLVTLGFEGEYARQLVRDGVIVSL